MSNKKLSVCLYGEPIGILEQTIGGKVIFSYLPSATQAISVNMPVRVQPYSGVVVEAFFGGLLPESDVARKLIAKRFGVSANNFFSLLREIGHDCAGAVAFYLLGSEPRQKRTYSLEGVIVSDDSLYEHIQALPSKPLFLGYEGLRLSLAGVQDKAAICLIDNQIAIPTNDCPTTHILKPDNQSFNGLIENEYFCMRVARRIGLNVPKVEIRQLRDISYLLIERYDRHIENGVIARIHQEDFCQALGVLSSRKYQNEGGPGLLDCFNLLDASVGPAVDRNMLISGVLFNFLIGNMDAHGKNFSLIHELAGVKLAPFYDLISTRVYPELTDKMAMKIGSKYLADDVTAKHWEDMCQQIQYRYPALMQLMSKMVKMMDEAMMVERENLLAMNRSVLMVDKIINYVSRSAHLLR